MPDLNTGAGRRRLVVFTRRDRWTRRLGRREPQRVSLPPPIGPRSAQTSGSTLPKPSNAPSCGPQSAWRRAWSATYPEPSSPSLSPLETSGACRRRVRSRSHPGARAGAAIPEGRGVASRGRYACRRRPSQRHARSKGRSMRDEHRCRARPPRFGNRAAMVGSPTGIDHRRRK